MKTYYALLLMMVCGFSLAQMKDDTSKSGVDGPYIFYHKDSVEVMNIFENQKWKSDISKQKPEKVVCYVSEKDSFVVPIQRELSIPKYRYEMPKKLIAISDIEGSFEQFKKILINNKVMDKNYKWRFGKGHLVLNGDFFDRGLMVTQGLWIIYKLEQEAEKAGGKVHFVLGNHDIMNLYGYTKYVRTKYYENAQLIGKDYTDFYAPNTELGQWLQKKNIVEVIGGYLFTHAGISPELDALGLDIQQINEIPRPYYFSVPEARKKADKVLEILLSNKLSPYWYRGIAKKEIDEEVLDRILAKFGVSKMVIGHTLNEEVSYLYGGKVIDTDVEHAQQKTQGLLIIKGKEYKVDAYGKRSAIKHL